MIYFVTAREIGRVKIGYSATPFARLSQLRTSSPIPLELERVCDGDKEEEARLHAMFSVDRLAGEWFALSPTIGTFMEGLPTPARNRSLTAHGMKVQGVNASQLAAKIGVSKGRMSQLKDKPWPPELALAAEKATDGALDAAKLSPIVADARATA